MTTDGLSVADAKLDARILVVDDEPEIASLLAEALREADPAWDVRAESDPKQALAALAARPCDCLVTDLVMPEVDGLSLAEAVRAEDPDVALIAVSGRGTLEAGIKALRLGFADFIEKPFRTDDLQRAVCRVLRRRRQRTAMDDRFAELAQAKARLEAQQADLSERLAIASHDLVLSNRRFARRMDELAVSGDVARSLMGVVELEDLLGLCAELLGDRVPCETASVALYEPQDQAVGLLVRAYPDRDEAPVLGWLRRPLRDGVLCRAAQSGRAVHVDDIAGSVLLDAQERELWPEGRLLAVPVPFHDHAVAVAALHRAAGDDDFATSDVKRTTALASVVGPAILTAKTHHRQRCQAYAALERVVEALEGGDPYMAGHSARVLAIAAPLGEALNLSQPEAGALQIGARLHDIGRVAVPPDTVNHGGPLTEAQREVVQSHALVGERLVGTLEFMGEVGPIVRGHHEAWDGTGYPDGKAGGEIPRVARILAAADAMDAMTSARAYRGAMDVPAALARTEALAGEQFDPDVVAALLDLDPGRLAAIAESHR